MARATTIPLLIPEEAVAFDAEAFDNTLIRPNGVPMVHWSAMGCPVGEVDPDDMRKPHPDHAGCSQGFIYTKLGTVTVGFVANSKNNRFEDPGRLDQATVTIIVPRFYDEAEAGERCGEDDSFVYLAQFDRMYLQKESILVPNWEKFTASGRELDRLRFPAVRISRMMDATGAFRREGKDFVVEDGKIRWLPGRVPPVDPRTGLGQVISAWYLYRPYWYVRRLPHEVRVAHVVTDDADDVERLPQVAELVREYVFENELRDSQAPNPNSPRQQDEPDDRQAPIIADLRQSF